MNWELTVYCDHAGKVEVEAPEHIVARILHVPNADFNEWRERALPDTPPAKSGYWTRLLQMEMEKTLGPGVIGDPSARDRLLTNRQTGRVMEDVRWRFHCPACNTTLPVRGSRMQPVLEKLRAHTIRRVSLAQLGRTMLP